MAPGELGRLNLTRIGTLVVMDILALKGKTLILDF